jgi:DNA-binding NarL/FixJ family response regulator
LIEKNLKRLDISENIVVMHDDIAMHFYSTRTNMTVSNTPPLMKALIESAGSGRLPVLQKLAACNSSYPVVVLTTTDDQHEVRRCYDPGCNAISPSQLTTNSSPRSWWLGQFEHYHGSV